MRLANDVTITVDSVSDDSTNSIVTFSTSGTAKAGRWVAVALPNYVMHSTDGENWTEGNLPQCRNWGHVAAGKNTFVAQEQTALKNMHIVPDGVNWTDRDFPRNVDLGEE